MPPSRLKGCMPITNTKTKAEIRQQFRANCKQIPAEYREGAGREAAKLLVKQPFFKASHRVACYLSTANEFDSIPIIEAIWQAKKQCYVPVLTGENEKALHFARYQYGDALHLNRYAILEPTGNSHKLSPESLDLVLLPLIAFDCYGHRLGSGGGYYDRTFAFLHANPTPKPWMIGLGFTSQQIDALPKDPWDIRLDGVITEKEFITCS